MKAREARFAVVLLLMAPALGRGDEAADDAFAAGNAALRRSDYRGALDHFKRALRTADAGDASEIAFGAATAAVGLRDIVECRAWVRRVTGRRGREVCDRLAATLAAEQDAARKKLAESHAADATAKKEHDELKTALPRTVVRTMHAGRMVHVPSGKFRMGSTDGRSDEKPVHEVTLASFALDETEVTVAQYRACVAAGKCEAPATHRGCNSAKQGRENHPANCVNWTSAAHFCRWSHKRLPTEAEWEFAARGPEGRTYPWGNEEPGGQLCWDGRGSDVGKRNRPATCPVGTYPKGASEVGALDMAGNVWEWTADWYGPYQLEAQLDPKGPSTGTARVIRGGGSINTSTSRFRSTFRYSLAPSERRYNVGFRCASAVNE